MKTQRSHFVRQALHSAELGRARAKRKAALEAKKWNRISFGVFVGLSMMFIVAAIIGA